MGFAQADVFQAETARLVEGALDDASKLLQLRRLFVWALIDAGKYAATTDLAIHNYLRDKQATTVGVQMVLDGVRWYGATHTASLP